MHPTLSCNEVLMSTSEKNVEDFDFIFSEAMRLSKLREESYDLYEKDFDNDAHLITAVIDVPKNVKNINPNQRAFPISSKSRDRLRDIAIRDLQSKKLYHKITIDEYIHDIRDSIYIHIKSSGHFGETGYASILSKADRRARSKLKDTTYYLAFNALILNFKDEISIGDVKIIAKDSILDQVKDNTYYDLYIRHNNPNSYDTLLCLTVLNSSEEMSKKRAFNIADFVYSVIKVFAYSYNVKASQLNAMHNPIKSQTTLYLAYDDNHYRIGGSQSFGEDLTDFWKFFSDDLKTELGDTIKELIAHTLCPKDKEVFADRLIDAFYWFGEASRDINESAQTVKLVTAMERIVTDPKEDNGKVSANFSKRASSMINRFHGEFNKWDQYSKIMYDERSNLVHGSQGLHKSYGHSLGFDRFELAYKTILSACVLFNEIGLETPATKKKMQKLFNDICAIKPLKNTFGSEET